MRLFGIILVLWRLEMFELDTIVVVQYLLFAQQNNGASKRLNGGPNEGMGNNIVVDNVS